ncbi:MAG TPA: CoA transferase, partial [Candidatus Binataceae bacterium]|nr:CoA transferase [Candidatus Binataceae bacterium]
EGQHIDLALVDCTYNSHDWQLAAFSATDGALDPQRGGTQRTGAFPYGVFKSKDGYIGIGVFTDEQWAVMARRIGREELFASPDFKSAPGRAQNQDMLKLVIEEWLATLPNDDEAIRILADELRLPAARLYSVGEFARDPILSRRMVSTMRTLDGHERMFLQSPHKFSRTPPEIPGPADALGQHTGEILSSVCGYSSDRVKALAEQGLIVETHAGSRT